MAIDITLTVSGERISSVDGHDHVTVFFSADRDYYSMECRATKAGEEYGEGKGSLVASFSYTPANTGRTFEIYDDDLVNGDGEYLIAMYLREKSISSLPFTLGGIQF